MEISLVLNLIYLGKIALPEFQRGYVWNRDQVRGLMDSLYHKYPVGSLLVWVTKTESASTRGDGTLAPGTVELLLDGQQRITSLYGIIKGESPKFFDGNSNAFMGLYFNLKDETFEFYAPLKMKDNPFWINVTDLMKRGVGAVIQQLLSVDEFQQNMTIYINRLNAVESIKNIDLHIEQVTGEEKTVDIVVEIFNKVNSGGTKLSKGDLALAKICAQWPEARDEMRGRLEKWHKAGFEFQLEWLLRCINTIITGEALFSALKDIDTPTFIQGLHQAEKSVDSLLNMIATRLGLDHYSVLGSRYSFPVMARYLIQRGGKLNDHSERDKLLYWYIHTFLWGRYAGSTESIINQDLGLIGQTDGALDRLIHQLRQNRGDLKLSPNDFLGWSMGARFYPLLYMLTRVCHALDWDTGVELSNHLLGHLSRLDLHHIFPKSLLYKEGYSRAEVNALANFTFLTQETNLRISNQSPEVYLEVIKQKQPGALESHWIPMNPNLWKAENYREFLAVRRELLAKAANEFLESLLAGVIPEGPALQDVTKRVITPVPGGIAGEEEEDVLLETNIWINEQGLPEGEFMYELVDPETGTALAMLDLAWPNGIQEGYSQPVALLIDETEEIEQIVNSAGYRYFTDVSDFRAYVMREILAMELANV